MGVLTEVSNDDERTGARDSVRRKSEGSINNRDLRDLSIDLNRTRQLAPKLGHGVTVISESGLAPMVRYGRAHFANGFNWLRVNGA